MYPSIWTSIYVEESPVDVLPRLHAQGWRYVELSCEHLGRLVVAEDREAIIGQVQETLNELSMNMPQAHLLLGANLVHDNVEKRNADFARVYDELTVCADVGVEVAVIHPGGAVSEELHSLRIEQFKSLAKQAQSVGVRVAIENMMDSQSQRRYGSQIAELHELIDAVGSDMLGICFDTSHANVQKLNLAEAVEECDVRLIATHISDNDGTGDQHKMPGYARINWIPVVQALRDIEYQGVFNLEIPGERGCPSGLLDLKVRHAGEITNWLLTQM